MIKRMTCIECPKGCNLSVDVENCKVLKVSGAKCPKGIAYAISEVVSPVRIFTATVQADGLDLKRIPVRTNKSIPKKDFFNAAKKTAEIKINKSVKSGDVIDGDFLSLGVKLLATREAALKK